jgi:hypothetical protein
MPKYAAGKYAYGISDRSGFRYRLKDMRKEWTGFLVGKDEWEPKHQLMRKLCVTRAQTRLQMAMTIEHLLYIQMLVME